VALAGPPGAGKSTTAAAFALRGFPVLSDDIVVLTERNGRFLVQPGYPRVNLWPDSAGVLAGSPDALPRIAPPWDKRFLDLDERGGFAADPLPLDAIYVLGERDAVAEVPVLETLSGCEALMHLVGNTYVNYLLDDAARGRDFEVLSRLVAQVPVRSVRTSSSLMRVSDLCEEIAFDTRRTAR
jgi:hypothetical protein